jgi:hypothetical protein
MTTSTRPNVVTVSGASASLSVSLSIGEMELISVALENFCPEWAAANLGPDDIKGLEALKKRTAHWA